MDIEEVRRFGTHNNAFGLLRLVFATLVIVSHTPELIDGNRNREILVNLFGTISFGELAVDGFFLVSGFLIVGSYLKTPEPFSYLRKRVARIYPAFIAASAVSLLIVAPLAGRWIHPGEVANNLARILFLQRPYLAGVFDGTPYPELNGAMWTIEYEFRCYLLVLLLGLAGVLNRVWIVAGLAVSAVVIEAMGLGTSLQYLADRLPYSGLWLGEVHHLLRLCPIFLVGSIFYLVRDRIRFARRSALLAAGLLVACLFVAPLAEPGVAIFGGYLIFATAQWGGGTFLARINNENDISYGLYLYAWPVEKLFLWYFPGAPILLAGASTWIGAAALGFMSWHLLEKPAMKRFSRPIWSRSVASSV